MANEIRVRGNLTQGTLSVALAAGDTTMSSAGLSTLPAVTSAGHAVIVCENEIMYCTAHTAAAATATILRGQEGTTAASHGLNVAWLHGPVVSDYDSVLGYAQVTASQTGITTEVDATSLSVTATVPYAQHRVRITGRCLAFSSVVDDVVALAIQQDGVQVGQSAIPSRPSGWNLGISVEALVVPSAASHTWKLRVRRDTGTGSVTLTAVATAPAFILVEDLGPAL